MVFETILKGLSVGSLSRYVSVVFTSDGKHSFYKDFDKILGLLSGVDYLYVVVFRSDKFHVHLIIRDCPFYRNQLKSIWVWICNCPKVDLEVVRDAKAVAVYLATQDSIDCVGMSKNWFEGVI